VGALDEEELDEEELDEGAPPKRVEEDDDDDDEEGEGLVAVGARERRVSRERFCNCDTGSGFSGFLVAGRRRDSSGLYCLSLTLCAKSRRTSLSEELQRRLASSSTRPWM
jgi:hypothetical protein